MTVTEIPLDPFWARCGHCGELVDREGPTFCASCERHTIGRRTDPDDE